MCGQNTFGPLAIFCHFLYHLETCMIKRTEIYSRNMRLAPLTDMTSPEVDIYTMGDKSLGYTETQCERYGMPH